MRDTLAALIERVETATGPDMHLDDDICEAVEGRFATPYTKSLDAALALVPEGWQWVAGSNESTPKGTAHVLRGSTSHFGKAATPALALVAAALRARMESER